MNRQFRLYPGYAVGEIALVISGILIARRNMGSPTTCGVDGDE